MKYDNKIKRLYILYGILNNFFLLWFHQATVFEVNKKVFLMILFPINYKHLRN